MILTCHESLVPGNSYLEKCNNLAEIGYSGIDLLGDTVIKHIKDLEQATIETEIKPTAIYSRLGNHCLLDDTVDGRLQALNTLKQRMEVASLVGAKAVIFVPIFGVARIRPEAEEFVLITLLDEIAQWAKGSKVSLILEPLNKKETNFVYQPKEAARIVQAIDSPVVKTMVDTYHMEMENQDPVEMIKSVDSNMGLVHFSDTNRLLPGKGKVNFNRIVDALQMIGYNGPIGLECKGPVSVSELENTASFLNGIWAKAANY
ncbi:sugar phosphate isomerase/epimerase family protein [Aquibacillus albus]|uniref:Sugar phosphate isomerase/epimerase n=1 Tax=Aquibacillus albus TaxID=1168171 RepID=A0ABS2N3Q8_9BACI|nr:sugar phosphate isomerase/epimerase family protein [Aquibacillus albus]MBM7572678.1 sugar phosphate isomerase/epimerase [Aquibacillus albus]